MNLLKSNVPNCDSVILSYFGECLETYRINQLLSSSVMLGCATEKLICLLYDAYYFWLLRSKGENNREVANLKNAKSKSISRQFELLTASIKSHKEELEPLLFEDYDLLVNSLFTIIRKNRNDAGHPTGKKISRDELQPMIYVFIRYCKKVYEYISLFSNPD